MRIALIFTSGLSFTISRRSSSTAHILQPAQRVSNMEDGGGVAHLLFAFPMDVQIRWFRDGEACFRGVDSTTLRRGCGAFVGCDSL
jgi:hypothetical protein